MTTAFKNALLDLFLSVSDALDSIEQPGYPIDVVFIDAIKKSYKKVWAAGGEHYYRKCCGQFDGAAGTKP